MGIFAQADKIIYILNDPLNVLVSLRMLFHDFLLNHKPSSVFFFFISRSIRKTTFFAFFVFKNSRMARGLQNFASSPKSMRVKEIISRNGQNEEFQILEWKKIHENPFGLTIGHQGLENQSKRSENPFSLFSSLSRLCSFVPLKVAGGTETPPEVQKKKNDPKGVRTAKFVDRAIFEWRKWATKNVSSRWKVSKRRIDELEKMNSKC